MARIVISEFMDEAALAGFRAEDSVHYDPKLVEDRAALLQQVGDAEALIVRNRTKVDADLLFHAPMLRVVGRLGVGLDNIDLGACGAQGIAVRPATGANAVAVAEYVIAAALSLTRPVFAANAAMLAGEWPRTEMMGGEVAGRTMGLLGFGGTARAVASRARGLGMEIAAHDPNVVAEDAAWQGVTRCDLTDLLARADILSLHIPLTPTTRDVINEAALARMKPGAILINTARGGIVENAALSGALRSGHLAGAAVDVFEEEPLTASAALVFEGVPNLILTPHIAGVTGPANTRTSAMTVANVIEELERPVPGPQPMQQGGHENAAPDWRGGGGRCRSGSGEQCNQDDDPDRNPEQPEQDAACHDVLLYSQRPK